MSTHRYPLSALGADYARAAAGVAFTWGPLAFVSVAPVMVGVLGGLGALFAAYGLRTGLRQRVRIEVDDEGLRVHGLRTVALHWHDLAAMRVRYYSTQRDRREGWMQLTLKGEGATVTLDSTLEGFVDITRLAADAARANGLALSPATRDNLVALGLFVGNEAVAG